MKQVIYAAIFAALFLAACTSKEDSKATSEKEVGTTFIRHILNNDFVAAKQYVWLDATNEQAFESFRALFAKMPKANLDGFKNANIIIDSIKNENDSVSIFNYTNSFEKDKPQKIKLVWKDNKWMVDLKYSLQ